MSAEYDRIIAERRAKAGKPPKRKPLTDAQKAERKRAAEMRRLESQRTAPKGTSRGEVQKQMQAREKAESIARMREASDRAKRDSMESEEDKIRRKIKSKYLKD